MIDSKPAPKMFISHNGADKPYAMDLATALRAKGVDAWLDQWEIEPGESLIQRINKGIGEASVFVLLLSPEALASRWVRAELDAGVVRRIENQAKLVSVLLRDCEMPPLLKAHLYIDARTDKTKVLSQLVAIAFNQWDGGKPPLGAPPSFPMQSESELSNFAWTLGLAIAKRFVADDPSDGIYNTEEFKGVGFENPLDFEDALTELEDLGAIKLGRHMGGDAWNFGNIQPRPALLGRFSARHLGFDPSNDVSLVLAQVASNTDGLDDEQLETATGLSAPRVAIAASTIDANGSADVRFHMGGFHVAPNARTRRLVRTR